MKYIKMFESYKIKLLLNELDEKISELGIKKTDYAIFGSAPLSIRGLFDPTDLDVLIRKDKYPFDKNPIVIGNLEFSYDWPDIDNIDELIDTSEIIEGHPFVKIEYVIKYKNTMDRYKDKQHLILYYAKKLSNVDELKNKKSYDKKL